MARLDYDNTNNDAGIFFTQVSPFFVPIDAGVIITRREGDVQLAAAGGNQVLAVWNDGVGSDVLGHFLQGNAIIPAADFRIFTSDGGDSFGAPRITTRAGYFVAAIHALDSSSTRYEGITVATSGAVGTVFPLTPTTPGTIDQGDLASTGNDVLFTWRNYLGDGGYQLLGRRFTATGSPIDAAPFQIAFGERAASEHQGSRARRRRGLPRHLGLRRGRQRRAVQGAHHQQREARCTSSRSVSSPPTGRSGRHLRP
ncbi:MAG: hypothetical protein IPJ65_10470 [Archangiaceae bacterium]|nr:hypothetical protein [Archangiaceae bacterium]